MLNRLEAFQRVKQEINLPEFVHRSYGAVIKERNRSYLCRSPLSLDRTPSFVMTLRDVWVWHCFSTDKGGTVIDLIIEKEGLAKDPEGKAIALKIACEYAGLELSSFDDKRFDPISANAKIATLAALRASNHPFIMEFLTGSGSILLANGEQVKCRALSRDAVEKYQIGYFDAQALHNAPVVGATYGDGCAAYVGRIGQIESPFMGRVSFPMKDKYGRVCAFAGRVIYGDGNGQKYINSPNSEIYNKSTFIYGLYEARSEISALGYAYIVEGQIDVVGLYSAGVKNVVACCGTSFGTLQAMQLSSYAAEGVIFFDGDKAGNKGIIPAAESLYSANLLASVVRAEPDEDPDSTRKKPDFQPKTLKKRVVSFPEWCAQIDREIPDAARVELRRRMWAAIQKIGDRDVRDIVITQIQSAFPEIPAAEVIVRARGEGKVEPVRHIDKAESLPEFYLLKCAIQFPGAALSSAETVAACLISSGFFDDTFTLDDPRLEFIRSRVAENATADKFGDGESFSLFMKMTESAIHTPFNEPVFTINYRLFFKMRSERMLEEVEQKIEAAMSSGDEQELAELLELKQGVIKQISTLK